MRGLSQFPLILTVAAALAGCAQLQTAWNAITGATVTPESVVIASNAFDAVEGTATNYLKLPPCGAGAPVLCRSSAAAAAIVPAIRSGRAARTQLEAAVNSGGATPIPTSPFSVLTGATQTLQAIFANYGIKSGS